MRSALDRFTDEILPVLAPHAAHLIVETWMTTGACGESEKQVTEDVARTTERPAETENEIVKLLRRAKELGVAPHVLAVGCDEYRALAGGGGARSITIACCPSPSSTSSGPSARRRCSRGARSGRSWSSTAARCTTISILIRRSRSTASARGPFRS